MNLKKSSQPLSPQSLDLIILELKMRKRSTRIKLDVEGLVLMLSAISEETSYLRGELKRIESLIPSAKSEREIKDQEDKIDGRNKRRKPKSKGRATGKGSRALLKDQPKGKETKGRRKLS